MHETVTLSPRRPNLVVGWAAGLLQVWPAEDPSIGLGPDSGPRRRSAMLPLDVEDAVEAHRLAS